MHRDISTITGATTGTAGVTFPWWGQLLDAATTANQLVVGLLGMVVLILTVRKLWLENQVASRRLRDMSDGRP